MPDFWKKLLLLIVVSIAWVIPVRAQLMLSGGQTPPFSLSVSRMADGGVRLDFEIAGGSYLYRDRLVASSNGRPVPVHSAPGISVDDATLGKVEVWRSYAEASISPQSLPISGNFTVTYQGCRDGGICLPPVADRFDLQTLSKVEQSTPSQVRSVSGVPDRPSKASGLLPPVMANASTSDGFGIGADGLPAAALAFVLFGLVLAFTPCVYPMYPVLAATLAGGKAGSRASGFATSVVFVVAMASVFAAVGSLAALGGAGFQETLRSPTAVVLSAIVLGVLALSAFGLFDISFRTGSKAPSGPTTMNGSRVLRAATGGVVAAFAAGPCVTAPLAGALLYVAKGGDPVVGALLLFLLGIGKGIPLVVFGTLGGGFLPRSGPWLQFGRIVSGLALAGLSVWTLAAVVPAEWSLAFWSVVLALAAAGSAFLVQIRSGPSTRVPAAAAALILATWSILLLVGAASGSRDPFHPLLTTAPSATGEILFRTAESIDDLSKAPDGRPRLVYVTADWCRTCATIDASVLSDPEVRKQLTKFDLLKVDVTRSDAGSSRMLSDLAAAGAPTLVFMDERNREMPGSRIVGETSAAAVLSSATMASRSSAGG